MTPLNCVMASGWLSSPAHRIMPSEEGERGNFVAGLTQAVLRAEVVQDKRGRYPGVRCDDPYRRGRKPSGAKAVWAAARMRARAVRSSTECTFSTLNVGSAEMRVGRAAPLFSGVLWCG